MKYIIFISLVILCSVNLLSQNNVIQTTEYGTLIYTVPDSTTWIYVRNGNDTNEIVSRTLDTADQPRTIDSINVDHEAEYDIKKLYDNFYCCAPKYVCEIQGKTIIMVLINSNGLPVRARIEETDSRYLNIHALKAVMKMNFIPAIYKYKYITGWIRIRMDFSLK